MSTHPRFLLVGTTAIALVAGLVIGAGAVLAQGPAAPAKSPAAGPSVLVGAPSPSLPSTTDTTSVPGTTTVPGTVAVGSGGSAAVGTAIYPYYGGTPGLAPDHTIVVTGTGQADLKSDGSNRAAAQKAALDDALADAKTQAEAIASATALSISGVLSVSASVSPGYGVVPMMGAASASGTIVCPAQPPTTGGTRPEPVCPPTYQPTLGVSVTVAYRVG